MIGVGVISKSVDSLTVQMLQLLIVPLSGIKGFGVVPSFYIKIMKRRTLQSCNLTKSIKKGHFFYFRQTGLIQVEQGESTPIFPLATRLGKNISIKRTFLLWKGRLNFT